MIRITGVYIRVSTEEQAKDGFSIHAQKEKLTKYAEANDWDIFDYYIDDGISGKNLEDRKEVTRLLKDVEKGIINNILIYKLDRLTRSVKDLIYLIEFFEKNNCTFNSQTEKIDTSNAVGRMFIKIIGIFAEFERENLAERVSFGYEQKTREGNYTNTNGVYGYDYIKGQKKIVVNKKEKYLVNKIFDMYIDGDSYFQIANQLNLEKVKTKRGGVWASSTIKSIINNPLYIGKVRYGVQKKNKNKSFIVDGNNIEPIISKEKWNLAVNIVNRRKYHHIRRYPNENAYFFHIIRCAKCGGKISPRQQKKNNKIYITYRCNNSYKGTCNNRGFSHKKMEKAFIKYLESIDYNDIINNNHIEENNTSQKNNLISNIKENWEHLINKEKKQLLERFIEAIDVEYSNKKLTIKNVIFIKKYMI